ncbi:hypothetical protein [Mycobacterium sp. Aquia_216]|uniref:hypothetical protein n=1 Tax=Mycobacterium sp. Aquia_216 TaxID=2991729 RepID=UPI003FA3D046
MCSGPGSRPMTAAAPVCDVPAAKRCRSCRANWHTVPGSRWLDKSNGLVERRRLDADGRLARHP